MNTAPAQENPQPDFELTPRMEQTHFAMVAAAARGDFHEAAQWLHIRAEMRAARDQEMDAA